MLSTIADLRACKSRAVRCENFLVGDGDASLAFAHMTLWLMPGRDESTKEMVGKKLLALMHQHLGSLMNAQKLQGDFTVSIQELPCYHKDAF